MPLQQTKNSKLESTRLKSLNSEAANAAYGMYKNIRNAAWQCLIDFNIKSLPINVLQITDAVGIKVIKNSEVKLLKTNQIGLSISKKENWYIIYDDSYNRQQCRFTIAHELGHILLGHDIKSEKYASRIDSLKPQEENEADKFASRLLAPACVIWALNLHKANDIASLCDISDYPAKQRAARMRTLYKRDKFLSIDLEKEVYYNFQDFINKVSKNFDF